MTLIRNLNVYKNLDNYMLASIITKDEFDEQKKKLNFNLSKIYA